MEEKEVLMTAGDVAYYLSVHEMTVYRWLKSGVVPGFKVGGRWRAKKSVLDEHFMGRDGKG